MFRPPCFFSPLFLVFLLPARKLFLGAVPHRMTMQSTQKQLAKTFVKWRRYFVRRLLASHFFLLLHRYISHIPRERACETTMRLQANNTARAPLCSLFLLWPLLPFLIIASENFDQTPLSVCFLHALLSCFLFSISSCTRILQFLLVEPWKHFHSS